LVFYTEFSVVEDSHIDSPVTIRICGGLFGDGLFYVEYLLYV
jgi:hypothetical protein